MKYPRRECERSITTVDVIVHSKPSLEAFQDSKPYNLEEDLETEEDAPKATGMVRLMEVCVGPIAFLKYKLHYLKLTWIQKENLLEI